MICKYEDYLKEPYILTLEQMQQIHNDLLTDLGNDPEALELYEELIAAATKYAAMRAKWPAAAPTRKNGYGFPEDFSS
ncbi:MAG: hypothetical protein V8T85_16225 [Blautia faecicola]